MLKKLIGWHIRKWWPLILIMGLIITIPYISYIQLMPMTWTQHYYQAYNSSTYVPTGSQSELTGLFFLWLAVPAMFMTFVMPLFVYIFRTSLNAVDCFYQAGYEKRVITRTRVLIGLGIILVCFTFAYFSGMAILALRYVATPVQTLVGETSQHDPIYAYRISLNFGYMVLLYFALVIIYAGQYFVNCFFVSLGDNFLTQVFLLILGNVVISLFLASPIVYNLTMINVKASVGVANGQFALIGAGPAQALGAISLLFLRPLADQPYLWNDTYLPGFMVTSIVLCFLAYVGAGVFTMIAPVPSGEYAGKTKPRNTPIAILPHIAALLIVIVMSLLGATTVTGAVLANVLTISSFLAFGVIYYALLSLLRKSFKPTKLDLISYLSVMATGMVLIIFGISWVAGSITINY